MKQKKLNVLIACECSQRVTTEFRRLGHNAFSADIQLVRYWQHLEWHIPGDVSPLLQGENHFDTQDGRWHRVSHWDLIIAHPPCTYLCKVSSIWMKRDGQIDPDRLQKMKEAVSFFQKCLHSSARYVAVENPLPMAMAGLPNPSCYVDPSWYGYPYSKKTCLWLKNLPPLMAEVVNPDVKSLVYQTRGKYRSVTTKGVARAMAEQWSNYIITDTQDKHY